MLTRFTTPTAHLPAPRLPRAVAGVLADVDAGSTIDEALALVGQVGNDELRGNVSAAMVLRAGRTGR